MADYQRETENYAEPTQAGRYAAYSDEPYRDEPYRGAPDGGGPERPTRSVGTAEPPRPWYRSTGALIGLGALVAVVLALAIFGLVTLMPGSSHPGSPPTPTSSSSGPASSSSAPPPTTRTGSALTPVPAPGTGAPPAPSSDSVAPAAPSTDTPAPSADTPAPVAPSTDTGTPAPSTVTQTVIAPRIPFVPQIPVGPQQ